MDKRSVIVRSSSVIMALAMVFAANLSVWAGEPDPVEAAKPAAVKSEPGAKTATSAPDAKKTAPAPDAKSAPAAKPAVSAPAQAEHVHGPSCNHGPAAPAQSFGVQADPSDGPVLITSPLPWSTLRSDSVVVSLQAELALLPKGSIDFRVVRRSGTRASTVFTKSVKMEEPTAEVFLGRVRELPVGGNVYLSIEWSVPGSDIKGVVEPVGIVRLIGEMTADNRWVPSQPPLVAVKLADGVSGTQAAEALAGAGGFEVGGMKFAAGWNSVGLFIRFTPDAGVTGIDFAFDLKCGKNAFLAWADRFVIYSAAGDSVGGRHFGRRAVDNEGLKSEELAWGRNNSPGLEKADAARVVMVRWADMGIQPFEERTVGFSVFANGRVKKQPASYPAAADRKVPGTWGEIKLSK
ncbi:MAG: hypothetical protein FWB94_07240 [Chitinispirillia bacterium]|nr:hypothetical protein [Chitinispirillia bacterium]